MKLILLLLFIITTLACHAQEDLSVKSGVVKRDTAFTRNFSALVEASKKGFSGFKKRFLKFDEPDSIWVLNTALNGTVGDSIVADDNSISLSEHYHFDDLMGWDDLVQKVKGALPADFHYIVLCNDERGCQYIFTAKADYGAQPSYDGTILLNVSAGFKDVTLMITHRKPW